MPDAMNTSIYQKGITFRSLGILMLLLFVMAVLKQVAEVILMLPAPAEHTLPLPAVWVFLAFLLIAGLLWRTFRFRLLSRAETLCVFFALLLAGPIMTQGFWHRVLSISSTIPRTGDFAKFDALSDRMWPHGPNLLDGQLTPANVVEAHGVTWEKREVRAGQFQDVPVLRSTDGSGAFVRFTLPNDAHGILAGRHYLVAVLVQTTVLTPDSVVQARSFNANTRQSAPPELFSSRSLATPSFMFPSGFVRLGIYGVQFSPDTQAGIVVEFGLSGNGETALADPILMDVSTLEQAYIGRPIVTAAQSAELTDGELARVMIRPDRMLSPAGLRFILAGYVPVRDWLVPAIAWTSLILLILTATFAIGVLLRRQWIDNERFPLPVSYLSEALLGREGQPPIWQNRTMWTGFAISMAWCLMRAWNFYNPRVPDLNIAIPLQPYFAESASAPMWQNVTLSVSAIFVSLAVFMELGVLMSIVCGFFAYRALFWIGDFTGMAANAGYPFVSEQKVAAFLMYALFTLFFTRKYWARVFRAAWRNDLQASAGEALSYRSALLLLAACFAGAAAWARWINVGVAGILVFFSFVVLIGLVSARIRTECGTPFGYFAPDNGMLLLSLLGGITLFGAESMLVVLMASFLFMVSSFFLNPGAQVELLQMGRERQVVPRHLLYAMLAGVVGGMVIGGWVFLSNAYAIGGNNMHYAWAFDAKPWALYTYNQELNLAAQSLSGTAIQPAASGGIAPSTWAWVYAGGGTLLLAMLRQVFAGFWFHPVGFILGSSNMVNGVWGSCLAAWVIRLTVLKIGGAATVREKLRPFFIGVFIAAALSQLIMTTHAGMMFARGIENVYRAIP